MAEEDNNKNEGEQEANNPQDQTTVRPSNGKLKISSITILVFIFLAEAGIICWMLAEHFYPRFPKAADALLLFGIIILGAVGVHNVIKSEEFQTNYAGYSRRVWLIFVVSCCLLAAVFAVPITQKTELTNTPVVIEVPQPNYVEGTEITQKQLSELFPFGYTLFYLGENKRLRYELFKTGMLQWSIDLDNVKIEPNIATGIVRWEIPPIYANYGTNTERHFFNTIFAGNMPFKSGEIARVPGFRTINQPTIYAAVINADQKNPVFAIGYRIPVPGEFGETRDRF